MKIRGGMTLAAYGLAAPAWAAELAGVTLPEQTTVEESTLVTGWAYAR